MRAANAKLRFTPERDRFRYDLRCEKLGQSLSVRREGTGDLT